MSILSNITNYVKRDWKNGKAGGTAISATNLNAMDEGIAQNREYINALNEGKADADGDVKFSSVNTKIIKSEDKDGAKETLEFISDGVDFESTDEVSFKFGDYIVGILYETIRGIGKIVALMENGKRYLNIVGSVTVKKTNDSDGDLNIEGDLNVDRTTNLNGDVNVTGDMNAKDISADSVATAGMHTDKISGKDSDDVEMLGGFTFKGDVEFTGNVSGTGMDAYAKKNEVPSLEWKLWKEITENGTYDASDYPDDANEFLVLYFDAGSTYSVHDGIQYSFVYPKAFMDRMLISTDIYIPENTVIGRWSLRKINDSYRLNVWNFSSTGPNIPYIQIYYR